MHDALLDGILACFRVETAKGEAEFLLDLREHDDET
jgi:hypothetical protein